jgi:glutamine synthetase
LKHLIIPVERLSRKEIETVLIEGERVDGSSLYPGIVNAYDSDIYIVPDFSTAFIDPFDRENLSFICRYRDKDGQPASFALDTILAKADSLFQKTANLELWAGGELEFYLIYKAEDLNYSLDQQKGYHESSPFVIGLDLLKEAAEILQRITGAVKYIHSEVGFSSILESENPLLAGKRLEQLEIEFKTDRLLRTADYLVLARWILRHLGARRGMLVTFAPKLDEGIAGNGLHIHLELKKNSQNIMMNPSGKLAEEALKLIGGLCEFADCFLPFGNTVAASYYRLVPNHEAPTRVFWSDNNRSALIRVPLCFSPEKKEAGAKGKMGQTVELRSPDGSALIHPLLAAIAMAANWAFENEKALEVATKYYFPNHASSDLEMEKFPPLPTSCSEAVRLLEEKRSYLERENVFPPVIIDYLVKLLQREDLTVVTGERGGDVRKILHRDLHRH